MNQNYKNLTCQLCQKEENTIEYMSKFDYKLSCDKCLTKLQHPLKFQLFHNALEKLYDQNKGIFEKLDLLFNYLQSKLACLITQVKNELSQTLENKSINNVLFGDFSYSDIQELYQVTQIEYANEKISLENKQHQLIKDTEILFNELSAQIDMVQQFFNANADLNFQKKMNSSKYQYHSKETILQIQGSDIFFLGSKFGVQNQNSITIYEKNQGIIFDRRFGSDLVLFQSQNNNKIIAVSSSNKLSLITLDEEKVELINWKEIGELKQNIYALCLNEDSSLMYYSDDIGIHVFEQKSNYQEEADLIENETTIIKNVEYTTTIIQLACSQDQLFYLDHLGTLYLYKYIPSNKKVKLQIIQKTKIQNLYNYININENNIFIGSYNGIINHYIINDNQFTNIEQKSFQKLNLKKFIIKKNYLFVLYKQELQIYKLDKDFSQKFSKSFPNDNLKSIAVFLPEILLIGRRVYLLNLYDELNNKII